MPKRLVSSTDKQTQAVEVGVVVKPHGIRGQLRVRLHNPGSGALGSAEHLWLRTPAGEVLEPVMPQGSSGGLAIISITGVNDRDAAETLRDAALMLARDAIDLEPGQYLYADLIGCQVVERNGDQRKVVGEVVDVFEAGASDVLVIREGKRELMIPLVDQWVVAVDLEKQTIQVVDAEQWD